MGGALSLLQSRVDVGGSVLFEDNSAKVGGALFLEDQSIVHNSITHVGWCQSHQSISSSRSFLDSSSQRLGCDFHQEPCKDPGWSDCCHSSNHWARHRYYQTFQYKMFYSV